MTGNAEWVITLGPGRRVDAHVDGFDLRTDQPVDKGGEGSAPSPFQLFLASIGTCAGIFVQGFCAKRNIPYEEIRILERPDYDEDGTLRSCALEIVLPPEFPQKYREAIAKVADQCSVKRAIHAQPEFRISTRQEEARTSLQP